MANYEVSTCRTVEADTREDAIRKFRQWVAEESDTDSYEVEEASL